MTALEGCGQDAGTLLRVPFETATAVLWMLQRNTFRRAGLYLAHTDVRFLIKCRQQATTDGLRRLGKRRLPSAQRNVDEWIGLYGPEAVDSVKKHWSGLPGGLEAAAKRIKGWHRAYNSVFRDTSAYAHGADLGDHLQSPNSPTSTGGPQLGAFVILPGDAQGDRVLVVANVLLFTITERISQRFGLGLEQTLGDLRVDRAKTGR